MVIGTVVLISLKSLELVVFIHKIVEKTFDYKLP